MTTPIAAPLAPSPLATPAAWDLVSADYAAEVVPVFETYARRALDLTGVAARTRVVDVATGPGTLAVLAAERGAHVTAIDFAPQMIAKLRARAEAAKLAIDARVGDGQALPFDDGAFDAGFSMFGLMFFPERARGLLELRRVVRAGGHVAIGTWKPFPPHTPLAVVMAALKESLPSLPFGEGKAPLGDADEIRAEMRDAGFDAIDVHDVRHDETDETTDGCWEKLERTLAPLVLLREKLGAGWPRVREEVRARLHAELGPGPVTMPMVANVAVARR